MRCWIVKAPPKVRPGGDPVRRSEAGGVFFFLGGGLPKRQGNDVRSREVDEVYISFKTNRRGCLVFCLWQRNKVELAQKNKDTRAVEDMTYCIKFVKVDKAFEQFALFLSEQQTLRFKMGG